MKHSKILDNRHPLDLHRLLRELVVPVFGAESDPDASSPTYEVTEPESEEPPAVNGCLRGQHLVQVTAHALDECRITLRLRLHGGFLIDQTAANAMLVGNLLDPLHFHVRSDALLLTRGQLSIGCDLVVRPDDAPLVTRRMGELLDLGHNLDWFSPLRLPQLLHWHDACGLELDWDDLPHDDPDGFLDEGLNAPRDERTPFVLLRLAQGLGRWQDVLRLLKDHPDTLDPKDHSPLKCMALCQLRRWLPAIRSAKEGGLREGRYPESQWLSPSLLHALIEAGDEIEVLRLLGNPASDDPGFYQWFRGLAFHRAGDFKQAAAAFEHYFGRWPGDVLGRSILHVLNTET